MKREKPSHHASNSINTHMSILTPGVSVVGHRPPGKNAVGSFSKIKHFEQIQKSIVPHVTVYLPPRWIVRCHTAQPGCHPTAIAHPSSLRYGTRPSTRPERSLNATGLAAAASCPPFPLHQPCIPSASRRRRPAAARGTWPRPWWSGAPRPA